MWCGVVWVWCGVVWCGVVWCGVVWCGMVWCGVVWCGVVWCGVVWCGKGVNIRGCLGLHQGVGAVASNTASASSLSNAAPAGSR